MWTWVSQYQNVSILDFIGAKDDGGDNWSCKTCNAPVKCHHQQTNTQLYAGWMSFLLPNQQCQSTEWEKYHIRHTCSHRLAVVIYKWRAPWKNRICSTTTKLRKSFVKPVTRQNILSCLVLPPEIVMHDAFSVILWTSVDICIVHDNLWWKNRTRYNRFWRAGCSRLEYVDIRSIY